jgi:low affinity Fe/Cu permease
MTTASHNDIKKVFPDLPDHAVVEILAMNATIDELDAALVMLTSDDNELIGIRERQGTQIHRLMNILNQAGIHSPEDRDG